MPRAVSAESLNATGVASPMPAAETPLTLKVPAAAKVLDVSESMVWKLIRQKRLSPVRIGRNTLIPHAQLVALVEGGGAPST